MTDWTSENAPAPVSDDELDEAAWQYWQLRLKIRGLEEPAVITMASTEPAAEAEPVPPPVEDPRPLEARSEPVIAAKRTRPGEPVAVRKRGGPEAAAAAVRRDGREW